MLPTPFQQFCILMKSGNTPLAWFVIQFIILKQIIANKSFQISISSLALADINDICVWLEVMEICDGAEEYRSRISTPYCWC